jgi:hypothetical protein
MKLGAGGQQGQTQETLVMEDPTASSCPEGLVFGDGKCTRPEAATAHVCQSGDVPDCTSQCEKGNAQSCDTLGYMFWKGTGVAKNDAQAAQLFKHACDSGFANGCYNQGFRLAYDPHVARDEVAALALFEKACAGGSASGCFEASASLFFARGTALT